MHHFTDAQEGSSNPSTSGELNNSSTGVSKRRGSKRSKKAAAPSPSRSPDIDIVETGMRLSHNRSLSNQSETKKVTFNMELDEEPQTSRKKVSRTRRGKKAGSKRKQKNTSGEGSNMTDKYESSSRRKSRSKRDMVQDATQEMDHSASSRMETGTSSQVDHDVQPDMLSDDAPEVYHDALSQVSHDAEPEADHGSSSQVDHDAEPEVDYDNVAEVDYNDSPEVDYDSAPEVDHYIVEVDADDVPDVDYDASQEDTDTSQDISPNSNVLNASIDECTSQDTSQDYIDASQDYLGASQDDLDAPQDDLDAPQDDLDAPQDDLDAPQDDLDTSQDDLDTSQDDLDDSRVDNHDSQVDIDDSRMDVDDSQVDIDDSRMDIDDSRVEVDDLQIGHDAATEAAQDGTFMKPTQIPRRRPRKKETSQKPTPTSRRSKKQVSELDPETAHPQRRSQRASFGVNKKRTAMEQAEFNAAIASVPKKKAKTSKNNTPQPRPKKQKVTEKKRQTPAKAVGEKKGKKRKSEERQKEDSSGGESDSSSDFDYTSFGGQDKYQEWVKRKSYRPNIFSFENEPLILQNDPTYYKLRSCDTQIKIELNVLNRAEVLLANMEDEMEKDCEAFMEKVMNGERRGLPRIVVSTKPLEVDFSGSVPLLTGGVLEDTDVSDDDDDAAAASDTEEQSDAQQNGKRAHVWTSLEQKKFEELMVKYPFTGNSMERSRQIASELGTRTAEQVRSHMQTNVIRLMREGFNVPGCSRRYKRYQNPPKRAPNNPHSSSSTALRRLAQQQQHNNHQQQLEQKLEQPTTSAAPDSVCESDSDSDIVYPEDFHTFLDDPENLPLIEEWKQLYKKKRRILKQAEKEVGKGVHEGFTCTKCMTTPITGIRYECKHCREMQGVRLSLCGSCMKMSIDGVIKINCYEHQQWHRFDYVSPGYIIPETTHHIPYIKKIVDHSWVPNDPNYAS